MIRASIWKILKRCSSSLSLLEIIKLWQGSFTSTLIQCLKIRPRFNFPDAKSLWNPWKGTVLSRLSFEQAMNVEQVTCVQPNLIRKVKSRKTNKISDVKKHLTNRHCQKRTKTMNKVTSKMVVVPVDGSENALRALNYYSRVFFGSKYKLKVVLFYLLPSLPQRFIRKAQQAIRWPGSSPNLKKRTVRWLKLNFIRRGKKGCLIKVLRNRLLKLFPK